MNINTLFENIINNNFSYILLFNISMFLILNFCFYKFNILIDKKSSSSHKKFLSSDNVTYSGGLILILTIFIFNYFQNYINLIYVFFIFVVGLLSDMRILNSSFKRLIIQSIIIILFIYNNDIQISNIKISYIDNLLENYIFPAIIFTTFCLLVLLNGSNFIDGVNLQCSGYYLSIIVCLTVFPENKFSYLSYNQISIILSFILTFVVFNFFNKNYLGDNGSYLLSFIVGIYLIEFSNNNPVSPYFIALLLWYPAYENFFSIIRRKFFSKNLIDKPDNLHLHHLIYNNFNHFYKKPLFKNNFTGVLIFLFNSLVFSIGRNYVYNSLIQVSLIIFSIVTYNLLYIYLIKKKKI